MHSKLSLSPYTHTHAVISTSSIYLTLQYFMDNLQIQLVNLFFIFSISLSLPPRVLYALYCAWYVCDRHHLKCACDLFNFFFFSLSRLPYQFSNSINRAHLSEPDELMNYFQFANFYCCRFVLCFFSNEDKCCDLFGN